MKISSIGLIQFSTGTFPSSVKTTDIDVTLRSKLWKYGISYKHDTGHGIGAFSSVKECKTNYKITEKNQKFFMYFFSRILAPILINYDAKQH